MPERRRHRYDRSTTLRHTESLRARQTRCLTLAACGLAPLLVQFLHGGGMLLMAAGALGLLFSAYYLHQAAVVVPQKLRKLERDPLSSQDSDRRT